MTWTAIDCLTPLTVESAKAIKQSGIDAVFRYLRNLTKAEVDAIHGAGLGLLLLYETNPTHRSYFTRERGISDAQEATRQAEMLGAPTTAVLCLTVDYDTASGDLVAIDAYVDGVTSAIGDRAGLYGDDCVISHVKQAGTIKWLFQTYGWSYGSKVDGIQAYQHTNGMTLADIGVDLDELYTRDGLWWPHVSKAAQAHQGGDDVQVPMLKEGVDGHTSAVEALQGVVGATVDGVFGPKTDAAVKEWQSRHGLVDDGIVGPKTWSKILA